MNAIWNKINNFEINRNNKNRLFVALLIILCGLAGAVVWLAIGKVFLPEIYWGLCFIGYPAAFGGLFGGILYLYNHEFEERSNS